MRLHTVALFFALGLGSQFLSAEDQKYQKVIYPDGTVRYEPIQQVTPVTPEEVKEVKAEKVEDLQTTSIPQPVSEASETTVTIKPVSTQVEIGGGYAAPGIVPAPSSQHTTTGVSCCPDNHDGGHCSPDCKKGRNDPEVNSHCPPGETDCEDTTPEPPKEIPEYSHDLKFYRECKNGTGTVPVPIIKKLSIERCYFQRKTYKVDCCEITVCVPCKKCVTMSKKCELIASTTPQKLRLCHRRETDTWDVYVYGVPGMPSEWLLYVDASYDEIKNGIKNLTIQ